MLIYVTQGHSAHLLKNTPAGIDGLYADDFSICTIAVGIGADKIVVIHVDPQTASLQVEAEFRTITQLKEIVLFFRKDQGEANRQRILDHLSEKFSTVKISSKKLTPDNKVHGVSASFSGIKNHSEKPKDLLMHPQELRLACVRIGEDIIKKGESDKQMPIFNGHTWVVFEQAQLQITCPVANQAYKRMKLLQKNVFGKNYMDIVLNVKEMMNNSDANAAFKQAILPSVYLETYSHNYLDPLLLFQNNIIADSQQFLPQSPKDMDFDFNINQIDFKEKQAYAEIETLIVDYKSAPETGFKQLIMLLHAALLRRKMYIDANNKHPEQIKMLAENMDENTRNKWQQVYRDLADNFLQQGEYRYQEIQFLIDSYLLLKNYDVQRNVALMKYPQISIGTESPPVYTQNEEDKNDDGFQLMKKKK